MSLKEAQERLQTMRHRVVRSFSGIDQCGLIAEAKEMTIRDLEKTKKWALAVHRVLKSRWGYTRWNPQGGSESMATFSSKQAAMNAGMRLSDSAKKEIEDQGGLPLYRGRFEVSEEYPDGEWFFTLEKVLKLSENIEAYVVLSEAAVELAKIAIPTTVKLDSGELQVLKTLAIEALSTMKMSKLNNRETDVLAKVVFKDF